MNKDSTGNHQYEVPHSAEAEEAVLGSLLIDSAMYSEVAFLVPEDFMDDDHKLIFEDLKGYLEPERECATEAKGNY